METTIVTSSSQETKSFAEQFAKTLHKGDVVVLYGELGSGKTTFVQGLAQGLHITKRIISPTFVILRSYTLKNSMFYHVDLYRLEGEKDIPSTGLMDLMKSKENIIAIEWPEKMGKLFPKKRWEVRCSYVDEEHRSISITKRD